jgi:hypothetical protein
MPATSRTTAKPLWDCPASGVYIRGAVKKLPEFFDIDGTLPVTFGHSLSENGPQRDTFRNHGGHHMKCDGRTLKIPKEATRRCFQQLQDRWSACARVLV